MLNKKWQKPSLNGSINMLRVLDDFEVEAELKEGTLKQKW
jgi:hypothetical protein